MFSQEDKLIALDLYFSTKTRIPLARFVRDLGYPSDSAMRGWIEGDPRFANDMREKKSYAKKKESGTKKFSDERRQFALDLYFSLEPRILPSQFVEELGYPSRSYFMEWLHGDPRHDPEKRTYKSASFETKLEAVKLYEAGQTSGAIAKRLDLKNKDSVYSWHRAWKKKGVAGLLPEWRLLQLSEEINKDDDNAKRKTFHEPTSPLPQKSEPVIEPDEDLPDDPEVLKAMIHKLQLDLAISEGVLDILKADPRSKAGELTNKEKTILATKLDRYFSLREICRALELKRSTYYYNLEALTRPDKHKELRGRISCIFEGSRRTWGSERIWATLRVGGDGKNPRKVSEKVVRRLMAEEGCAVIYKKRRRHYSSYAGEISKAPANLVKRNFRANKPNELWLTDITEFKLPNAPKVYLSAIIDCFDGKPIAWKAGLHPNSELANETLRQACAQLAKGEKPTVHSDRGAHYRWPGWIDICEANALKRSMSKKGCSPDNSAMEGFFGTLKNEFFYYRDWSSTTAEEFIARLDEQLRYHCEDRIKKSLGWLSPTQYRQSLGIAA